MPLVIDTYNVLHVVGVLPPEIAGPDVGGLAALIAGSRHRHEATTLVCDGRPPAGESGHHEGVQVCYAGPDRTADDVIAALVKASSSPRRLTVVSSDREVLRTAKRRRCPILTAEVFLRQLADDHSIQRRRAETEASPGPLGTDEVETWMGTFQIRPGEASDLSPASRPPGTPPAPDRTQPPASTPRRPRGDLRSETAGRPAGQGAGQRAGQRAGQQAGQRADRSHDEPLDPAPAQPARPVLPPGFVAEAAALVREAEAEREAGLAARAAADADADAETARARRAEDASAKPAPRPTPDPLLPDDILADARRIAGETPAVEERDRPRGAEPDLSAGAIAGEPPGPEPPRRKARPNELSSLIEEAESLWMTGSERPDDPTEADEDEDDHGS